MRRGSRATTVALRRPAGSEGKQDRCHLLTGAGNRWILRPSGGALITVMKSADLRNRNDAPGRWRFHFSRIGAVVVEGLMRAGGVVVHEVPAQQTSEMPFVEHDDVIEAFPSNGPKTVARTIREMYLERLSPRAWCRHRPTAPTSLTSPTSRCASVRYG